MTDSQRTSHATTGDAVNDLLLGFAAQIDQLAALIGGNTEAVAGEAGARVAELTVELGTLIGELGDLLARIIAAFIAVLEAIAEVLRSSPETPAPAQSRFQAIDVRIAPPGAPA
ncbi:MAG: hypothetical protein QM658_02740 [Gordonia sp. (in: high G+C Gram-positive bacteria)]